MTEVSESATQGADNRLYCESCLAFVKGEDVQQHKGHKLLHTDKWKYKARKNLFSLNDAYASSKIVKNAVKYVEETAGRLGAAAKPEVKEKEAEEAKVNLNNYIKEREERIQKISGILDEVDNEVKGVAEEIKSQRKALKEQEMLLDPSKNPEKYLETLIALTTEGKEKFEVVEKGEKIGAKLVDIEQALEDAEYYPLKTVKTLVEESKKPRNYPLFKDWAAPYAKKMEMSEEFRKPKTSSEGSFETFVNFLKCLLKGFPDEFMAIIKALGMARTIILSDLPLGESGVLSLLQGIKKIDDQTQGCYLDSCNLGEGFAYAGWKLLPKNLKVLSLAYNPKIGSAGLESIFSAAPIQYDDIACLDVSGIALSGGAIEALKKINAPYMSALILNDCQISSENASKVGDTLKHFEKLRVVFVDSNALGDEGALTIVRSINPLRIEALSLANNGLTEKCVPGIIDWLKTEKSESEKIPFKGLVLCRNQLGDSGLKLLASEIHKLPTLQGLFLRDNHITDEGILSLVSALTEKKVKLRGLWLNGNPITDKSCEVLSNYISKLALLSLDRTKITGEGVTKLANAINKESPMTTKRFALFEGGTEYKSVKENVPISLSLDSCSLGSEGALPLFKAAQNGSIETLNLTNTGLDDKGLEKIAEIMKGGEQTVKQLFLIHNRITSKGVNSFNRIISGITESETKFIRGLYLDENSIGNESFEDLTSIVKKLKVEMLSLTNESKINVDATVMFSLQNYNTWFLTEAKEIFTFRTAATALYDPMRVKRTKVLARNMKGVKELEQDLNKLKPPCVLLY